METIKTIYKIGKGPSSSHTIGPDNAIRSYINKFDMDYCDVYLYGSLALTGKGHLTDYVIEEALKEAGVEYKIHFDFKTDEKELGHPNTMKIIGKKSGKELTPWTVFSVGGGNIVVNNKKESDEDSNVYPHSLFKDIAKFCEENNIDLLDYVNQYERDIDSFLNNILELMLDSVETGLSKEGAIHGDLNINRRAKKLFENAHEDVDLKLSAYAYAVSEENATGGVIVTAPTCGACGVLPAVLYYYK
ncbi:MAG: serine dehydratase beta chain, partial [Bacilli bacterium]